MSNGNYSISAENKDFLDVEKRNTVREAFRKVLIAKEQECTEKHKPFCRNCATADFDDEVKRKVEDAARTKGLNVGTVKPDLVELKVIPLEALDTAKNIDKYAEDSHFKKIGVMEAKEPSKAIGTNMILIGHHHIFQCIKYGNKFDVFVPLGNKEKKEQVEKFVESTEEHKKEVKKDAKGNKVD